MAKKATRRRPSLDRQFAPAAALSAEETARRDTFAPRMLSSFVNATEILSMYLGLRLGYYESLRRDGTATPKQLATRTKTNGRYAREWLEQQAVAGILTADGEKDAARRRYTLPPGHADVLLNEEGPAFLGFAPRMTAAVTAQMPALLRAYRRGTGVAWNSYGDDMTLAQGGQNRGFLRGTFGPAVMPSIKDIDRRLRADPPARVADLACGLGWASVAIAENYPKVHVDGLDLDGAAVRRGRKNVRRLGLHDRVRLDVRDIASPELRGKYDLVVMVESLHDLSQPVPVLRAARKLLAPGAAMLVVDENVAEEFTAPGSELERVFYGFSVLACLANGMADKPSAATGTVMRPATVTKYATAAGFRRVEVVPFAHDFFRFYRLDV